MFHKCGFRPVAKAGTHLQKSLSESIREMEGRISPLGEAIAAFMARGNISVNAMVSGNLNGLLQTAFCCGWEAHATAGVQKPFNH
jgi:hypothetical protein